MSILSIRLSDIDEMTVSGLRRMLFFFLSSTIQHSCCLPWIGRSVNKLSNGYKWISDKKQSSYACFRNRRCLDLENIRNERAAITSN